MCRPGKRGVSGFPAVQHQPEVSSSARQCSTWPANSCRPAVGACISSQGGHQPDDGAGEATCCTSAESSALPLFQLSVFCSVTPRIYSPETSFCRFFLNRLRTLSLSSLSPWEEWAAPSSRPSSPWPPSRTCSRFRCRAAGFTTSASSRRPRPARRASPALPTPAQCPRVNSKLLPLPLLIQS